MHLTLCFFFNFAPFDLGLGLSGYLLDAPAPAISFRSSFYAKLSSYKPVGCEFYSLFQICLWILTGLKCE
jgi:hypothetical protein